jgi:hypothetical protein
MSETVEPFLNLYKTVDKAPKVRPGGMRRQWMDDSPDRYAYRCLPLSMANSTGWEILSPCDVELDWNGGKAKADLKVTIHDRPSDQFEFASSHFMNGIATFHTGYLFRTPPGWAVWCSGPPNSPKDGVYPLSGLIETDWLPFPFTMNWQMTRPGKVSFDKDEPFCFVTLLEHNRLEAIKPVIRNISADKVLDKDYRDWSANRNEFNARLNMNDESAVKQGWQRHYMKGGDPHGQFKSSDHRTKRRLQAPRDLTGSLVLKNQK